MAYTEKAVIMLGDTSLEHMDANSNTGYKFKHNKDAEIDGIPNYFQTNMTFGSGNNSPVYISDVKADATFVYVYPFTNVMPVSGDLPISISCEYSLVDNVITSNE